MKAKANYLNRKEIEIQKFRMKFKPKPKPTSIFENKNATKKYPELETLLASQEEQQ